MKKYISKEDALHAMCRRCAIRCTINCPPHKCGKYRSLAEDIAAVIPADVKPVVRGKWEIIDKDVLGEKLFSCPRCGGSVWRFTTPNYRLNCGADMRERRMRNEQRIKTLPVLRRRSGSVVVFLLRCRCAMQAMRRS